MILTGAEIFDQIESGGIQISNFDPGRISPNAYDLTLSSRLRRPVGEPLDSSIPSHEEEYVEIGQKGFVLDADDFWLGESVEVVRSDEFVPILHAKSGTARLGLFIHVTGDLLQLGFDGRPTFQLFSTLPVRLHAGAAVAQISFWRPCGNIEPELARGEQKQ